jgi:hypothetical protein
VKLLTLLLLLATPCVAAIDSSKMLHSIAQVETGNRNVRGAAGEISPYQMTPAVWRLYSGSAKERARKHLLWLETQIPNPTPYRLALAWNGGLGALKNPKTATRDYASRVCNLYND